MRLNRSSAFNMYKFIGDIGAAPFLLDGILKFTPIAELNDPSELIPRVSTTAIERSRQIIIANGYTAGDVAMIGKEESLFQRLAPECQVIPAPKTIERANQQIRSPFYNDTTRVVQLLNRVAQVMSPRVGLLCLTRRFDSLPMWAHYANNAAGYAIEFQNLDDVFTGDETGVLNELIPISYTDTAMGVTFKPGSYVSLFTSKYPDWKYEQEERVILPLSDLDEHELNESSIFTMNVGKPMIKRVILGWRISESHENQIRGEIEQRNPNVQLLRASISDGRVVTNA